MSAMFRPPIAITSAIGWRQVFGFGHGDDPFFALVRAAQLAALNRYVPFNVALMTINIAALVWSLRDLAQPGFLFIWGASSAAWRCYGRCAFATSAGTAMQPRPANRCSG